MSVATVFSLAFLLAFSPIVSGSAAPCPGPDCEKGPAPVYTTTTEPCDECEHMKPTSTCTTQRTVIPYTSGSSTFYIHTTTLTEHATCESTPPQYCENKTKTVYQNGTGVAPAEVSTVSLTQTITSWKKGPAPATVTVVETKGGHTKVMTETDTVTQYNNGPPPKTVTKVRTEVSRVVRTEIDTITKYQSGPAPKTVTKVTTKTVSPKKETVTITGPAGYCPKSTVTKVKTVTEKGKTRDHTHTVTQVGTMPPGYTATRDHTKTVTHTAKQPGGYGGGPTRDHTRTVTRDHIGKQTGGRRTRVKTERHTVTRDHTRTVTEGTAPVGYTATRDHTRTINHTKTIRQPRGYKTKTKTKTVHHTRTVTAYA